MKNPGTGLTDTNKDKKTIDSGKNIADIDRVEDRDTETINIDRIKDPKIGIADINKVNNPDTRTLDTNRAKNLGIIDANRDNNLRIGK